MSWSRRGVVAIGTIALLAWGSALSVPAGAANPVPATTTAPRTLVAATGGITSVRVQLVRTTDGTVAYRQLGKGTPLLLIMGLAGSIDDWEPAFVNALAAHFRVIVFDNAGVGQTSALPSPLSVTAMADQTSAFVSALGLRRIDALGWSMGGMVAQALTVLHPGQVHKLVLAATQPGTGHALPVPPAAAADVLSSDPTKVLSVLFPSDEAAARQRYLDGILGYPGYYQAPRSLLGPQSIAVEAWLEGRDPAGHDLGTIRVPTLVADGTVDALDPVANDKKLASTIPGARLALYPGAGHGFLFQDAGTFVRRLEKFLG